MASGQSPVASGRTTTGDSQLTTHGKRMLPWTGIVVAVLIGLPLGFATVLEPSWPLLLARQWTVQTIAVGVASGVALYAWGIPEHMPFRWRSALLKGAAGGVFGFLAAKIGAGFGLNEHLQTAAAGVGGAKGPDYADRLAATLLSKGKA